MSRGIYYEDAPDRGAFYHLKGEPVNTGKHIHTYSYSGQSQDLGRMVPVFAVSGHEGMWSTAAVDGFDSPPSIGARVFVNMNGFASGEVIGYFVERGKRDAPESSWLGVEVRLDKRPDWHVRQCGDKSPTPLVFGAEIRKGWPPSRTA